MIASDDPDLVMMSHDDPDPVMMSHDDPDSKNEYELKNQKT